MRSRILAAALVSSAAWFVSPASAQTAAEQDTGTTAPTDEIIVTATRDSRALQDVPMSVDVATGEQLQSLNIFDVKDVQQLSPGLELTNFDGRSNTTSLRGITFNPDQGTGPAVQVYLNEVPADAQTVFTAIYDLSQIEVLRGPQGTLRGLSSPAGAITMTTRRPDFDQVSGYLQATATDLAGYNVQGGVTLPFSSTFAIRAAMLVDGNRLNHVRNVNRGDRSQSRTESARLTLGWQPSAAFTGYLTYQYLTADNIQYTQVFGPGATPDFVNRNGPAATPGDRIAVVEGPMRFENETHLVNLNLTWDLGPATLSFVGAHQNSVLSQLRDQDPGNAVPGYQRLQSNQIPFIVNTGELRLASSGGGAWNWALGAFYSKQTGDSQIVQQEDQFFARAPASLGLFLPVTAAISVPVFQETISFNATSRFQFGQLSLEGGLRYSILRKRQRADIVSSSPGYPGFGIPAFTQALDGIPTNLQRRTDRPLTGGASIAWEPSRDVTFYAAYGHSFRQGSAGVAVPVGISDDLILSGPEKTDSFEVGMKASFLDRRLSLNVAAFYQKYDGYLSRFPSIAFNCPELPFNQGCGTVANGATPINNATDVIDDGIFDFNYNGDATVKGVEATLTGRPLDSWDVSISASYARGRYDDARLPCNDYDGDGRPDAVGAPRITGTGNVSYCLSNGRIAEQPDFSLTANSELRFPLGDVTPFVRGLVSHRPAFTSEIADFRYPSRTMVNLFVGVRGEDDRWELNVFARNLLDQDRVVSLIGLGDAVIGTQTAGDLFGSGYRIGSVMNPREFGLTASFRW